MSNVFSDIDFTKSKSFLIVGKNKLNENESNGVGKTTIFRAIEYCLFNKTPTNLEKIVRDGCDKCNVTFEFESEGQLYKLQRTRSNISNKSDLKFEQKAGDSWQSISGRTIGDLEIELNKVIKINNKVFNNTICFQQNELSELSVASKDKRKLILKEALQLFIYSKLEKIEEKRKTNVYKELTTITGMITSIGDPASDVSVAEVELKIIEIKILEKNEELENLRNQLSFNKIKLSELEKNVLQSVNNIAEKLSNIRNKKRQIEHLIFQIKGKIQENKKKIDELSQDKDSKISILNELEQKLINIKSQKTRSKEEVKIELDNIKNKEIDGVRLIAQDEGQLENLQKPFPEGEVCLTCLQTITSEHRLLCKQKLDEDVKKINDRLVRFKETLLKIQKRKKNLENEFHGITDYLIQTSSYEKDIKSKKEIIENNIKLIHSYNEIKLKKEEELKEQESIFSNLISQELEIINESKEDSTENFILKINNLKVEIEKNEHNILLISRIVNEAVGRKGAILEKIKLRSEALVNLESLKETSIILEKKLKIQNYVLEAFSSNGIPSLVIHTILDDLQIECNNLLLELRPGLQMEFILDKEKDGIKEDTLDILYTVNGKEREWDLISGGQKFFLSFCLKLGLSKVIQQRLGVSLEFLLFDEIDRFLDAPGVLALAEAIKKLHDRFKIFIITHNSVLLEKFNNIIVIEGNGINESKASVVIN